MHSSNQKIVLINPCGWQRESVNLGLSYLAACLLQKGFEVLILDLNRYELDDTTLLERVRQYEPFLVGISVKTATAEEGGRLAILLAGILSNTVLVVGGPHVTLCAEMYLQENPAFSFGIMGEGEESFVALARALQEGHPASEVKGIVWRRAHRRHRACLPGDLRCRIRSDYPSAQRRDALEGDAFARRG